MEAERRTDLLVSTSNPSSQRLWPLLLDLSKIRLPPNPWTKEKVRAHPDKICAKLMPPLAKSSLPAAQEAARVQEIAADTRVDRMAIWVQNVESECLS